MRKLTLVLIAAAVLSVSAVSVARADDLSSSTSSLVQELLDWLGLDGGGLTPYDTGIGTGE